MHLSGARTFPNTHTVLHFSSLFFCNRSESSTNWVLAGYEGGNPKAPIVTVGSGDNGLDEMKGFLESDKVLYGLLRVTDLVDDITTVKFVYITW